MSYENLSEKQKEEWSNWVDRRAKKSWYNSIEKNDSVFRVQILGWLKDTTYVYEPIIVYWLTDVLRFWWSDRSVSDILLRFCISFSIAGGLGVLFLYLTGFSQIFLEMNIETYAQFGDSISGAIGTIWAFASVLLFWSTYQLQRMEVRELTKSKIKESELEYTRFCRRWMKKILKKMRKEVFVKKKSVFDYRYEKLKPKMLEQLGKPHLIEFSETFEILISHTLMHKVNSFTEVWSELNLEQYMHFFERVSLSVPSKISLYYKERKGILVPENLTRENIDLMNRSLERSILLLRIIESKKREEYIASEKSRRCRLLLRLSFYDWCHLMGHNILERKFKNQKPFSREKVTIEY